MLVNVANTALVCTANAIPLFSICVIWLFDLRVELTSETDMMKSDVEENCIGKLSETTQLPLSIKK